MKITLIMIFIKIQLFLFKIQGIKIWFAEPHFNTLCFYKNEIPTKFWFLNILTKPKAYIKTFLSYPNGFLPKLS